MSAYQAADPFPVRLHIENKLQVTAVTDKLVSDHTFASSSSSEPSMSKHLSHLSHLSIEEKQNVQTLEAQALECDLLADRSQTTAEMESWTRAAGELRETARRIRAGMGSALQDAEA